MIDKEGRETVTVTKDALLTELRKNRSSHREVFEKAIVGWQKTIIQKLEESIADARANRRFSGTFHIPRPEDQTSDYDRIIKMVEMSVNPEVILTREDFACYVMDDWRWKETFTASTAMYMKGE